MALAAPMRARASPFAGGVKLRASALRAAVARSPLRAPLRTSAGIFDGLFGAKPEPVATSKLAYLCIDCGYIYNGDLSKEGFFYKCPVCDSGKNRFTLQKAAGSAYNDLAAAKKQAKAAKAASGGKGERPRDKLRAEAIERARKFDEDRGRGGGEKKKGGWPF